MEIHQLRYFVAVAEEGSFPTRRSASTSRNLLSVGKSISWKRNCRLRSATARQETDSCVGGAAPLPFVLGTKKVGSAYEICNVVLL
jgi:hypothetical protein